MGKNRKRNRKNKACNEQTFDEVKVTSVNKYGSDKDSEVDDVQKKINSVSITDSNPKSGNSSKNTEMITEFKKETEKQKFSGIETEKTNSNNSQFSFEVNSMVEKKPSVVDNANKMQGVTIFNNNKKIQASTENNSKPKILVKNNQVENPKALVYTTSRGISGHQVPEALKAQGISPERKGLDSVSKMTGAKPKEKSQVRSSMANDYLQKEKDYRLFNQNIRQRVNKYENNWKKFAILYPVWKNKRQNTIAKLQELVQKVHEDQRGFNQTNVFFKDLNVGSRQVKDSNSSPTLDFFTSLATFVTDAASGLTSVAQAANVDEHTATFKEIMEEDGELTKPLHAARSQCFEEYKNVEEIIRQRHFKTFGDTFNGVSKMLRVEDLLSDIRSAKGENRMEQITDEVALFFKRNANLEVLGEVYNSVNEYLDSNPAAFEACKSAGKAMYGIYDTWGRNHNQGRLSIEGNVSAISNRMMLTEQQRELRELRSIASNDNENQAKLESEIHFTISSLQRELREISTIFEKNNEANQGRPWYF